MRALLPGRGSYFIRAVDRFVGIPLVFFLGLFRRERLAPEGGLERFAVLMSAAIGDAVLSLSVVSDLKRHFPKSHITIFSGDSNEEFLRNQVSKMEGVEVVSLTILNPISSIYRICMAGTFDIWFDTGQWQRVTALYTFFARASWKVGFRTPGQARHFVFDLPVSHMRSLHELENYRNLVRRLGIYEFAPPQLLRCFDSEPGRVGIHAFAGGSRPYLKEWPEEYWVELINVLLIKGKTIFLTGAKSDQEKAEKIARKTTKPYAIEVFAGKLSLQETMHEISRAEYLVSVNTGIMHLSAALGIRTIGLHGPTSVRRWGPIGKNAVGIQSKRSCSPCLNLGFDYGCPRNDCMRDLKVEEVLRFLNS